MRQAFYSTVVLAVCALSAAPARAERAPNLDEALASVLPASAHAASPALDGGDKLCRTLTDMGRRSRHATVCMDAARWQALVQVSRAVPSKRPAVVRLSLRAAASSFDRLRIRPTDAQ